jgi:hypothetical protein
MLYHFSSLLPLNAIHWIIHLIAQQILFHAQRAMKCPALLAIQTNCPVIGVTNCAISSSHIRDMKRQ